MWWDAQYDGTFDEPIEDYGLSGHHLALVHSVGYYIDGDARAIVLASSRGPRNSSARFLIAIPRSGITSARLVRRAKLDKGGE